MREGEVEGYMLTRASLLLCFPILPSPPPPPLHYHTTTTTRASLREDKTPSITPSRAMLMSKMWGAAGRFNGGKGGERVREQGWVVGCRVEEESSPPLLPLPVLLLLLLSILHYYTIIQSGVLNINNCLIYFIS